MRILQLDSQRTALEMAQLLTVFDSACVEVMRGGQTLGRVSERDLVQRVLALRRKPEEVTLACLVGVSSSGPE